MNEWEQCISEWADRNMKLQQQLTDAKATVEALRRERDKLREMTKIICGHCCEPMAIPSKAILQSQLSALQGLVRALPRLGGDINEVTACLAVRGHRVTYAMIRDLLRYRATLDATPTEEAP